MKNNIEELHSAEAEVDESFRQNALLNIPYPQAVWTLLTVVEDIWYKRNILDGMTHQETKVSDDNLLNEITHPLRVLLAENKTILDGKVNKQYDSNQYGSAHNWLLKSQDYAGFCIVFPWLRRNKAEWRIENKQIITESWKSYDFRYEVYNTIHERHTSNSNPSAKYDVFEKNIEFISKRIGNRFIFEPTPKVLDLVINCFGELFNRRYTLPLTWSLSSFTVGEFSAVMTALQSIMLARRQLRIHYSQKYNCVTGGFYSSSVWVTKIDTIASCISISRKIPIAKVKKIIEYLTFGKMGVRNPDIAIQPIIDIGCDYIILSPFAIAASNAERNLCVLVNQIPVEKSIYSQLTNLKEGLIRTELIEKLEKIGIECRHGKVGETDIDLALIDRNTKICLCIELKWFIEPSEVREISEKSKEISKGIEQCQTIERLFQNHDPRLMSNVLDIDMTFKLYSVVGSANWIGFSDIQDVAIPTISVWHMLDHILAFKNLSLTIDWLKSRNYLPNPEKDFDVYLNPSELAGWKCCWYGFHLKGI